MRHLSHRSVLYQTAIMSGSGMILAGLGFFYRMIQSRLAGAEGMGLFSMVMPVYGTVVALSLSGITVACNHLTAEAEAKGRYDRIFLIFRAAAGLFTGLFLVMGGGIICLKENIAEYLLKKPEMANTLLLFLPCIFLTGFENICKGVFYGLRRVEKPVRSELGEQTVRLLAVWALLGFFPPQTPLEAAQKIIVGMTVSEVFSSTYMTYQLGKLFREIREKETDNKKEKFSVASVISLALPVSAASVAGSLISGLITVRLPILLEEYGMMSEEAIGELGKIGSMASPLLCLPLTLIGPISSAVAPRLTASNAKGDSKDVQRKANKAMEAAGMLALPFLGMLMPVSGVILKSLFGVEVEEEKLFILALSVALGAYQSVSGAILHGFGMHRRGTFLNLTGSLVHLICMTCWVPIYGIKGYLWAAIPGSLLPLLGNLCLIRVPIDFKKAFLQPLLVGGAVLVAERAVYLYVPGKFFPLAAALTTGGLVYTFMVWVCGYRPKAYLKTLTPKEIRQEGGPK